MAAERELDKRSASLVVAYGRRRIGKSRLLRQAAVGRNEIYFQATRVSSVLNMEQFKLEVARVLGPSPVLASLDNWESIFPLRSRSSQGQTGHCGHDRRSPVPRRSGQRFTIGAPTVLGLRGGTGGKPQDHPVRFCVAQMEDLLAETNPLYGRVTLRLEVRQLPLRDLPGFFPEYSAEQLTETYAIFGGVPYYLTLSDQHASLRENVINLLLTETGTLIDEPNTLLLRKRVLHKLGIMNLARKPGT
ncbi:hypothetical protein RFN25_27410 [Mesorhizobium abyssinicae]|uniref:ATP-binding protein n=1 Tax=Mesorhizobium abyssinicae TaxID=1209958 RepID=A0ABU5ATV1_9HYPH|nr:hypothetical protein [Mesorhizobium abyssinicae]MDX8437158.1 hypothetical protein [Mesorhizobium abyssinicae]MDX8540744.1 hypothetical protein [Mesorhizobium abyssinicae]